MPGDSDPLIPIDKGGRSDDRSSAVRITSGPVKRRYRAVADVVFVIDTTGSMDNEIDGLLQTCQRFVDELAKRRIDWQVAIVSFGDLTVPGDRIEAMGFSKDVEITKRALRTIPRNDGGANEGESCLEALMKAIQISGYRANSIRTLILMTDEPALTSTQLRPETVIEQLRKRGYITFVISEPLRYYREMAKSTGGEWFQITNDTKFLSILDVFGQKVSEVISEVQSLAGGDVRKYRQLKAGR